MKFPDLPHLVRRQGSNIGNHTFDHRRLDVLSGRRIRQELRGGPNSDCVRPPYGATNARVRRAIHHAGARQVLWTIDTLDWTRPGARAIIARATTDDVRAGSIILMHDGGGERDQTVEALPTIIRQLQHRHLRVRRLPGC